MFGTDGIRGYPNTSPLKAQEILDLAYSFSAFLKSRGKPSGRILIGRDTRNSGIMMESALVAGFTASGWDVILGGVLPTPAISLLGPYYQSPLGIVLSASHNPARYNGIKVLNAMGEKLTDEEESEIARFFQEKSFPLVKPEEIGTIVDLPESPQERYKKILREKFPLSLSGYKILLDCAQGATFELAPQLMAEWGAEVKTFFASPDGKNINQNCGAVHPEVLAEEVKKEGADIAFSFDGDGDRVIAVDEKGEVRDGDFILAILGKNYLQKKNLPGETVVSTSMANLGLELALQEAGGRLLRTQVGDRFVYEEMKKGNYILGGEQSGHVLLTRYGRTGDGIATALELIRVMKEEGKSFSQLCQGIRKYPQLIHNLEVSSKPPLEQIPGLSAAVESVEKKLEGRGRLVLRYSGTESLLRIMLEGESLEMVESLKDHLAQTIQSGIAQMK